MTIEDLQGPRVPRHDGSPAAERAIRIALTLVRRRRGPRARDADKPTERSSGVGQALTGGRIDAPVSREAEAHDFVDRGVAIAADAGFDAQALLAWPTGASPSSSRPRPTSSTHRRSSSAGIGLGAVKGAILGSVSREVVNAYNGPSSPCERRP